MARATGLEITETSVRVADLEGSGRKYKIHGAAEVPIAADENGVRTPDAAVQAIKAAFKASKARRDAVVLGFPAREATIREIVIPFTDPEQIRKVIKFESESHLPASDIEDVVVAFHKIGETGPRSRMLIMAVTKDALRSRLELLARAGVDPLQIDLDAAALFSVAQLVPDFQEDEQGAHVTIDVGAVNTTVILSTGEHLRMVRCVRMGSESMTRHLTADLGIERTAAESVTREALGQDEPFGTVASIEAREPSTSLTATQLKQDIIKETQHDLSRRLVTEIRRSLSSAHLHAHLQGIWITGSASTTPGLDRSLGEAFNVPVRPLDTLYAADHKLPEDASLFVGVPSGLALKILEHDPLHLDFRQEEFRHAHRFERVKTPLIFAAALVLVLLCFLCITEWKAQAHMRGKIGWLVSSAERYFDHYFIKLGKEPEYTDYLFEDVKPEDVPRILTRIRKVDPDTRISRMLSELRRPTEHIQREYGLEVGESGGGGPSSEAKSALLRLNQFLTIMGKNRETLGSFNISRLEVSSTEVKWNMSAEKVGGPSALEADFKKLAGFKEFTAGSSQTGPSGDWNYVGCRLQFDRE